MLLVSSSLFAQGFQIGGVIGQVTDETGGVLPGVSVTVTSVDRGLTRTETTDSQGKFRFASLPLGTYRVEAALSGFQSAKHDMVRVEADKNTTVDFSMRLAGTSESLTVTAEAPVVDPTTATVTTRVSTEEYEKAPVGRSYQSLVGLAPGITGGAASNPNSSGALSSANQFLFDGVDSTDPTTGTFGSNLNFEAIQEVNVMTNAVSAEYGRATGAVVNVITKSGTNDFEGSLKSIVSNDEWNDQNKTINQISGASFERTKIDHNNIRYAATLGGPLWKDHLWFFGAYDTYKPFSSAATTTVTNEEYSSKEVQKFQNYRLNWQITPSQGVWAKFSDDPITGIARNYSGATDIYTLSRQDQGGDSRVLQYSGVFGSNFTVDAMFGKSTGKIIVSPWAIGPFDNGAAILNNNNTIPLCTGGATTNCASPSGQYYNGNYFGPNNNTSRPRKQYVLAGTYFASLGGQSHELKAGIDRQNFESGTYYSYGNDRLYVVRNYNVYNGTFTPVQRRDFLNPGPQVSEGKIDSVYLRDKFSIGRRWFFEVGGRYEKQDGQNDVGANVVEASTFAPRLSMNYDLFANGQTLVTASYGRYYDFILQSFADNYAEGAQRANFDLYVWNATTSQYVFNRQVITAGGQSLTPAALGLDPNKMDEYTVGLQHQLGRSAGVMLRYVHRKWSDLIEDHYDYDADGNIISDYFNYDGAFRDYDALQAQFDKRFGNNWSLLANYTYSRTKGNFFSNFASVLVDFPNSTCVTNDTTVGNNGTLPCADVMNSIEGRATYDSPHVANVLGTYGFHLGPVNLTFGVGSRYRSGFAFSKIGSATVVDPFGELGESYSYYYEGTGSDRLPSVWSIDNSLEATFGVFHGMEVGVKGEVFNVTNRQGQINTTTNTWSNANTVAAQTSRNNFGKATSRTHYQDPRSYRVTVLFRF
ncbi:MAG TPA: TonB-dependent receptor [Thermoanaerobaculia bacterium]|nr:TonB-dependent receptor [Thermoanaerobaculia bacterium]